MFYCLYVYSCNFSQKKADGGGQVDAAPLSPSLLYYIVYLGGYVLQVFHQWCKNMEVRCIRCQLEVVNGEVLLGVLLHEQSFCRICSHWEPPHQPLSLTFSFSPLQNNCKLVWTFFPLGV